MDDHPTPGQLDRLRDEIRHFVDDEVIPVEAIALRPDHRDVLDGLMADAKRRGLWALGHPTSLGGRGWGFTPAVALNEVIGRSAPAAAAVGAHSLQDALLLLRRASAAQRSRWLAPLVEGEIFASMAMTEPEVAGSDPRLMRTTAREERDGWVIDGHKWFIGWADRSSVVTVIAKTDPHASLHRQFSAFLVPTDAAGYEVVRLLALMGDDESHHGELRFDGVWVSADALLGARGDGFAIAQAWLGPARILDAARWLGQAERAFELMCATARTRYAHGSYLAEKSDVHRRVAESAAQIHATRLVIQDAARTMDDGDDARVKISIARMLGTRMLHDVIDRAMQVHGAAGLLGDLPLERMSRDARKTRIYDGPEEVHRLVVARSLLAQVPTQVPW